MSTTASARIHFLLWLAAATVLILLTRWHGSVWPLSWPDEALFSSPAAELATHGHFTTPVLSGLVPGMQQATLWNSPLYMVLTALAYYFTGESQLVARLVSTACALAALWVFIKLLNFLKVRPALIILGVIALLADLTFIRAANLGRMDMLTLFWMISALYFTIKSQSRDESPASIPASLSPTAIRAWLKSINTPLAKNSIKMLFFSGMATGLAAMSHPIAIILLPFLVILCFPYLRKLMPIALGAMLALIPWILYILQNPELFALQFKMQLDRKEGIFQIFLRETGGIFKVFFAQYGEGKILMLLAVFWLTGSLIGFALLFWYKRNAFNIPQKKMAIRLGLIAILNITLVMLASEGWYAVYISPLLILALVYLTEICLLHNHSNTHRNKILHYATIAFSTILLVCMTLFFHAREILAGQAGRSAALTPRHTATLAAINDCKIVYLRAIPDPYFEIRKTLPHTEILEFIPGKLSLPAGHTDLSARFDTIDCFLLNDAMDWEPQLEIYLNKPVHSFQKILLDHPPLPRITLWRRRKILPSQR